MAVPQRAPKIALDAYTTLSLRLEEARACTDALFQMLSAEALYERPIPERHRLIFYLGHLEAFDSNLLGDRLGERSADPAFDKLFAFGIDPVGGGLPTDAAKDWPTIAQVQNYNRTVRARLDNALRSAPGPSSDAALADGTLLNVAIEHRLMHAETLAYLLHNLSQQHKSSRFTSAPDPRPAPAERQMEVPAGAATLGQSRDARTFGWDNEFEAHRLLVPAFAVDAFPVTNAQYLEFVRADGYDEPKYWSSDDWRWRQEQEIYHPHFWIPGVSNGSNRAGAWGYRAMFGEIPLPPSWPVYVSHAEASAFARWAGKKLPTEAQWHRAAYGSPHGIERDYPWGSATPDPTRGNFHHERWDAIAVDAHPAGASAFGVFDLLGNGWEWTSSVFAPLPGFEPFPFYPGYSANFFDGKHFVMKGGSPRTDACMIRRSFRNWFQPQYPYIYATFRCVEE